MSTTNNSKSKFSSKKDNKAGTGINNVRHVRNIESQLSHLAHLSDSSIFRHSQHKHIDRDRDNSILLGDSGKKSANKSKKHISSQFH